MVRILGLEDVTPVLESATITVVGYGSQGRAHARNLRDCGLHVRVGLRPGASFDRAVADGFEPQPVAEAVRGTDLVAMLAPDTAQPALFREHVAPALKPGATLLFAHGFAVHYGQITPPQGVNVVLVAPKGPGNLVREQFAAGRGVPSLLAVHTDATGNAEAIGLAYAHGIGATRAGVLMTTFAEETETDLFGEQAVLCGGVTQLMVAGYETLVDAGYQPEVAYFECLHELKLIVDLLHVGGLERMYRFVSDTAGYGALSRGPRVVDERVRETMRELLAEVQDGRFASEWVQECAVDRPHAKARMRQELALPVEAVGAALRERMPWLGESARDDQSQPAPSARTAPTRGEEVKS